MVLINMSHSIIINSVTCYTTNFLRSMTGVTPHEDYQIKTEVIVALTNTYGNTSMKYHKNIKTLLINRRCCYNY